jgi:hypothetical protein
MHQLFYQNLLFRVRILILNYDPKYENLNLNISQLPEELMVRQYNKKQDINYKFKEKNDETAPRVSFEPTKDKSYFKIYTAILMRFSNLKSRKADLMNMLISS